MKRLGLLKSVFCRISVFIDFSKRKFVERRSAKLYFDKQPRM